MRSIISLAACLGLLTGAALAQTVPPCQGGDDTAYTQQIHKYTTEPFFLTSLVDHLPYDSCVPAPDVYLHHIIGAPDVLDYVAQINGYLRLLASKSPRVKVFSLGKSEEGREMLLVAVADSATIAHLDHYQQLLARLADPRGLSDDEARAVVNQAKPVYWVDGSIHSPEPGSPEMLMELAYRLAVENTPFIQNIRDHAIVLITPVVETDGRDREVDLYEYHVRHPHANPYPLTWWGHYVSHDNNRDALTLSLDLSKNMEKGFIEWHPQVWHDLHESESYLYVSTGTGPYNPWLDPIEIDEMTELAWNDVQQLTARGIPGVWTHGFFDGWAANAMVMMANLHNSIGRFYETQGNGGADTREVILTPAQYDREWYRPNPPLPKVLWSARDNANLEESGVLFSVSDVATNGPRFLWDFYLKSKHAVTKARTEGPAAYVFPGDDPRPFNQARLLDMMEGQSIEISRADQPFTANGRMFPAGSYIVRMDQPYSRVVDNLLDTDYYNPHDPRPYDDAGWTMGPLANVETARVMDPAILSVPMSRVRGPVTTPGGIEGGGGVFLVDANADVNLASFRFRLASVAMQAAEEPFTAAGRQFSRGSFIISGADRDTVEAAARDLGLRVYAVDAAPTVASHALLAPRIALMHDWQSTQQDGWFRVAMDELRIPYTYIADTKVRVTPNLRDQFDAIILPPMGGSLAAMLTGISLRGNPMPWMNTAEMPNLFAPGLDQSDDIRGGLGTSGLVNLDQFVKAGGLLISVTSSNLLPADTGMTTMVSLQPARTLYAPGDVLVTNVEDPGSPIAYGYGPQLDVYYNNRGNPILHVGMGGGFGGFGGENAAGRSSGRGSLTDPDVIQGRPYQQPEKAVHRTPREQELYIAPELRQYLGASVPPPDQMPRVILRFTDDKQLIDSGLIEGAEDLAEKPAVVEVPYGQGHIVLFSTNPMWRNENGGSYDLLFNAIMNYRSLDVGQIPAQATGIRRQATGGR